MQFAVRLFAVCAFGLFIASARAQSSIRLTAFPSVSVADSKSTVSITAEVRDQNGKPVPDGSRIVLTSSLGTFREQVVTTSGGIARGILVAGTVAGIADITASAETIYASPSTLEYEFVADRSLLSSAKEYIEIVAPGYMQYTVDTKMIGAAAAKGAVSVRYRDVTVTADDIQYNIATYELRARKARLKMGSINQYFDELYLKLNARYGLGTTTSKVKRSDSVVTQGRGIAFVAHTDDGKITLPPLVDKYGLYEIHRSGLTPEPAGRNTYMFTFEDISGHPSTVSAKKAVIFPRKEIQFQRAQIYVESRKVMTLPLFEVPLVGTSSPVITDQIVTVNNSQLGIDFPYYLSLAPGETSLLRFVTGEVDGRSETSDKGVFVNYELNWNKGDDMQGGLSFAGIGRDDWEFSVNQYVRFNESASASAQVLTAAGRSIVGSSSISQQFPGWSTSLSASATQVLIGLPNNSQDYAVEVDKDPIKLGTLPARLYIGLTAKDDSNQLLDSSQSGVGGRVKVQSLPIPLNRNTSILASVTTQYLKGPNELDGLQYFANVGITRQLGSASAVSLAYDYTRDGFNEYVLGEHRLSSQLSLNKGPVSVVITGAKSLDLESENLFGDASYKLGRMWRLTSSYTFDRYLDDTYLDYTFGFTYRLGWKEIGLIWSEETKRIGLQFLSASIY